MIDPNFALIVPRLEASDAEKSAIAEMDLKFSDDRVTANVARINREGAEARAKAPTRVAEIEREIASEREVQERAKQAQENWTRLKATAELKLKS